jgi:hypothetical protein
MTKASNVFAVQVKVGINSEYSALVGWDRLWATQGEADAYRERAARNDGWTARVVSLTLDEAAAYGWIQGLRNDARYYDLCRTYGDTSDEVYSYLRACIASQNADANHT